jgi:hypothetical protein
MVAVQPVGAGQVRTTIKVLLLQLLLIFLVLQQLHLVVIIAVLDVYAMVIKHLCAPLVNILLLQEVSENISSNEYSTISTDFINNVFFFV